MKQLVNAPLSLQALLPALLPPSPSVTSVWEERALRVRIRGEGGREEREGWIGGGEGREGAIGI